MILGTSSCFLPLLFLYYGIIWPSRNNDYFRIHSLNPFNLLCKAFASSSLPSFSRPAFSCFFYFLPFHCKSASLTLAYVIVIYGVILRMMKIPPTPLLKKGVEKAAVSFSSVRSDGYSHSIPSGLRFCFSFSLKS